jgi:argininosuccinate lyase
MTGKPWDGRFEGETDRRVEAFTSSISIDSRLYRYDIQGSAAHCRMLARCGIVSEKDAEKLVEGLEKVRGEIERGEFVYDDRLEDIHMHIEDRLRQIVGQVASRLHTARSRNDQVALDLRLYLRDAIDRTLHLLHRVRSRFVEAAERNLDVVLPGYTHLQRAQPVLLAHHLLAYYEMFTRDAERFREGRVRTDVMPLGAAALAGTTYPIDRQYTAQLLGFSRVSENSMDTVADRDFGIEFLASASLCMVHLSRLSEELVLWSSGEFAFLEMPDAFATGSSIMPQKKNPDIPELIRGKAGSVFGHLTAMLCTMKALPLTYNRDMQEDKKPLFETVDTLSACLDIVAAMLPELRFNSRRMRRAAAAGYLNATDLADYLVAKGMPFREAHGCVGRAVSYALEKGRELDQLSFDELRSFSDLVGDDVYDALSLEQVVNRRESQGGTARANVASAIERARRVLAAETP